MNKYTFLLGLILFSGLVSASPLEVNFLKESYFLKETIQGEIFLDGVLSGISSGTMSLQRNDSIISFSPYVVNLGRDHYFFYFSSESLEKGSYNLFFNNVIYSLNEITQQGDFDFDFELNEVVDSIISFSPGLIDARDNSLFDIYIKNEGVDSVQLLLSGSAQFIEPSDTSLSLNSGESNLITVYVSELLSQGVTGMEYLLLNHDNKSYSIPVWFGEEEFNLAENETELENEELADLSFVIETITKTLEYGETIPGGYVEAINPTNLSIENVSISMDEFLLNVVNLETSYFDKIDPGEIFTVYLNLNEENSDPGIYEGNIYLESGEIIDVLYVSIEILEEIEEFIEEELNESEDMEIIEEEEPEIIDEEISEDKKEFKFGVWFWALLFLIIIGLILYLVYNKKKKKTNLPFFGD